MSGQRIFLCHPNARLNPMMPVWIDEVCEVIVSDSTWADWDLTSWEYDMSSAVSINDVASTISSDVGPCVLLRNVQERVIVELRERLYGRSVVVVGVANDSTDILGLLDEARAMHLDGEPRLPRKLVIGLLLLGKLNRHQMWGGRNKGYMWASDLGKGRGVDEQFSDQLPAVINDLYTHGLLISKPSNGKNKYALNPGQRREIYEILRSWRFPGSLHTILLRDERLESARRLDSLYSEQQGSTEST